MQQHPRSPLSRRTELSLFAAPDRNAVGPVDQTASPWRTEDTHQMVGTTRFRQQGPFSGISGAIERRHVWRRIPCGPHLFPPLACGREKGRGFAPAGTQSRLLAPAPARPVMRPTERVEFSYRGDTQTGLFPRCTARAPSPFPSHSPGFTPQMVLSLLRFLGNGCGAGLCWFHQACLGRQPMTPSRHCNVVQASSSSSAFASLKSGLSKPSVNQP